MPYIGIDFETFGSRDLTKVGLDNYISDPKFKPLCCVLTIPAPDPGSPKVEVFEFVGPHAESAFKRFDDRIRGLADSTYVFAAHNAGFERAVLRRMEFNLHDEQFIDTAMLARMYGADSHLANAAPQLLSANKMEEGLDLIRLFSIPQKDGSVIVDTPDWQFTYRDQWNTFITYCSKDSELGLKLAVQYGWDSQIIRESTMELVTSAMNQRGWPVDMKSVHRMKDQFEKNKATILDEFRQRHDSKGELNLRSSKQLQRWCKERGVTASSFNEGRVESMIKRIETKLADPNIKLTAGTRDNYVAVLDLLLTKQALGGSSLNKLDKIIALTGEDGRLRHQYVHVGAGQSYRTTGRGVQMQNLKRFGIKQLRMDLLPLTNWTNEELAANLRQVFTASDRNGVLIVGDLSSIESRATALLAGEQWKLDAYVKGLDIYKILAAKINNILYEDVTKVERQSGKVGELSCGYGAGAQAVRDSAAAMGIELSLAEAQNIVDDWRLNNPHITDMWFRLNEALRAALKEGLPNTVDLANGFIVEFDPIFTPMSLLRIRPVSQSIAMNLYYRRKRVLTRVFHGCYFRGRDVCYYKPSSLKGGPLWKAQYTDPKTKQRLAHKLYGGKLTGILVQSFCRELFFDILREVEDWKEPGVELIGQFHDEIVLDWSPSSPLTKEEAAIKLHKQMINPTDYPELPLAAEVKFDYRYTK